MTKEEKKKHETEMTKTHFSDDLPREKPMKQKETVFFFF